MLAVIDNYDSFVFNLVQAFGQLGEQVRVFRNDAIDVKGLQALAPDGIVISPGPGAPSEAGVSEEVIRSLSDRIPILGVCLGHQAIASAFGARVVRADAMFHGKASSLHHSGDHLFDGLPRPFVAGRYHSLVADARSLPSELQVTAWTSDGVVMGLRHVSRPLYGVQFHPESVLTPQGPALLDNFLKLARAARACTLPSSP